MALTLLEIVQAVCDELGLPRPATVAGSTNETSVQILALLNAEGRTLCSEYEWTALQAQIVINMALPIVSIGNVGANSATITNIPSTAGLSAGSFVVSGTGIPQAARVASIVDSSTITMDMLATGTALGNKLTFSQDTYSLPADFDRYIGQTWWDRTNHWRLMGPDSPQMAEYLNSGIFATGPRRRFRQVGRLPRAYRIWPPPGSTDTPAAIVFDYISKNWVQKGDGATFDNALTADTDISLFDDRAMIMGAKWRLWQIKNFQGWPSFQAEYVDYVNGLKASDGGIPDLYLNSRPGPMLITGANVQDSNFPGPV